MKFKNLVILDNPLIKNYLAIIRDRKTSYIKFRACVEELSLMLAYESARELSTKKVSIKTPLTDTTGEKVFEKVVLLPILRAGLGFIYGFNRLYPEAIISHIGIYRDEEDLTPVQYYFRFPIKKNISKSSIVFILDPMLATGGSINYTISKLKTIKVKKIVVISLLCAADGVKEVFARNKDVKIYTCALDPKLNKQGFIVPGLGDAGDRIFGT